MAEKRRGLGRGLGSLIPSQETGRPSDVFFPRGERSDEDTESDAPAVERETLPSDPAESMRRAQAGRRTGPAKRGPGNAATEKSTAADAGSKSAATKAATAAGKTAKSSGRKSDGPSAPATAAQKTQQPAADPSADPAAKAVKDSRDAAEHASGTLSSSDKSDAEAAPTAGSAAEPKSVGEQSVSQEASSADSAHGEVSVDGVYVSRETVRGQTASEEAQSSELDSGSPGSKAAGEQLIDDAAASGTTETTVPVTVPSDADHVSPEADELTEPGWTSASGADVSHETGDESDDPTDDLVPVPGTTFGEIPLDRIRPNPRQPRDVFDEDALEELITSIREIGVLQPVVVRRRADAAGQYELIMGERRFRASKDAGKQTIPAIVRETSNDDLLRDALLENLHRVDLNPLEEAAAYSQLLEDFDCTQEQLSERIGRSRPQISNTIRLLKLPAMVQRRVAAGVLSSGHARALLGLNDGGNMEVIAQRVVAEGLSVRATEEAVVLLNRGDRTAVSRGTREPDPELAELARSLGDRLDTRVNLVMGKRKGKLSVDFANGEDLARILSLLGLEGGSQEE